MSARSRKIVAIIYGFAAIITFGHSAANQTVCDPNDPCAYGRPVFAAAAWPLYWSWEIATIAQHRSAGE